MGELDAASVVEIVREGAEADASVVILGVEGGSVEVLGFADAGSAFGDVASALDPSIIAFVYGRVSFGTDVTTSRKLVLLTWVGPETTTIERGRIAEQRAQLRAEVKMVVHVELEAHSTEEAEQEEVVARVRAAIGRSSQADSTQVAEAEAKRLSDRTSGVSAEIRGKLAPPGRARAPRRRVTRAPGPPALGRKQSSVADEMVTRLDDVAEAANVGEEQAAAEAAAAAAAVRHRRRASLRVSWVAAGSSSGLAAPPPPKSRRAAEEEAPGRMASGMAATVAMAGMGAMAAVAR